MDSEGMTRAWPTAPLMSRKARPTQNHATISRRTLCSIVSRGSFFLSALLPADFLFWAFLSFTFHHYGSIFRQLAQIRSCAYFQLNQIGRVVSRITRRTEIAFGVVDGLAQTGKGEVAERVGAEK